MGLHNRWNRFRQKIREPHSLKFSTLILTVGGLLSKILGIARQWLMADIFGTTALTDSWLMASLIPSLFFDILSGTFNLVLMPLLSGRTTVQATEESADLFLDEVFSWTLVFSVILIVLLEWLSPDLVHWIAPGFHGQRYRLTLLMLRIMLPSGPFLVLGNFMNGILQSRRSFTGRAVTPIIINIVRVASIAILGTTIGITGVAIGFVIGHIVQLGYLIPALHRQNVRLRLRFKARHPWTRQFVYLALPTFLSHSVTLGGTIVDRIFASTLKVGRIAGLNFAQVLTQIPLSLVVVPFMTPIYTELSGLFNQEGHGDKYQALAHRGFQTILMVITPAFFLFTFLRLPIIDILYEHGRFNAFSAHLTSRLVLYWAIGLPGEALGMLFARFLFSQRATRASTTTSIVAIVTNVAGDFLLIRPMGASGLALATSIAAWVRTFGELVWLLRHQLNPLRGQRKFFQGWITASILCGLGMYAGDIGISRIGRQEWYLLIPEVIFVVVISLFLYGGILVKSDAVPMELIMQGPVKKLIARIRSKPS